MRPLTGEQLPELRHMLNQVEVEPGNTLFEPERDLPKEIVDLAISRLQEWNSILANDPTDINTAVLALKLASSLTGLFPNRREWFVLSHKILKTFDDERIKEFTHVDQLQLILALKLAAPEFFAQEIVRLQTLARTSIQMIIDEDISHNHSLESGSQIAQMAMIEPSYTNDKYKELIENKIIEEIKDVDFKELETYLQKGEWDPIPSAYLLVILPKVVQRLISLFTHPDFLFFIDKTIKRSAENGFTDTELVSNFESFLALHLLAAEKIEITKERVIISTQADLKPSPDEPLPEVLKLGPKGLRN